MDRIDAMNAFVAVVDAGGFSSAARQLGRSAASMTRAVAFLEDRLGVQLFQRTTRTVKLTETGERYLADCRRILGDLNESERLAAGERASPKGILSITAPATFGRLHVRPIVDSFLDAHADVQARLFLLDRVVNVVDEGIDVAIRIANLPDSSLVAVAVGEVRRVVCASPDYLARRKGPKAPTDLTDHACIAFSQVGSSDTWPFASGPGGKTRHVKIRPRLTVNSADAAIGSALDGRGVTCVLSYQVEDELRKGRLVRLLKPFEEPPLPVHVVYLASRAAAAKVRAFVDHAVPILRGVLSSGRSR